MFAQKLHKIDVKIKEITQGKRKTTAEKTEGLNQVNILFSV